MREDDSPATYGDVKEIINTVRSSNGDIWILLALGIIGVTTVRGLKGLEKKIEQMQPQVQTANVLGDSASERFYVINGDTAYIEIDGAPMKMYNWADRPK